MDDHEQFINERNQRILGYSTAEALKDSADAFLKQTLYHEYSYNFEWMGLPVIQYPQDLLALQEIIWRTQPDLIIETGIARGGSLVFYASILALLGGNRKVVGIDIDFRAHNKARLIRHPMAQWIEIIEGSSVAADTFKQVQAIVGNYSSIMLCLDSNHTHEHVLQELNLYAPLVTQNNYCVVFDTIIEEMPEGYYQNRPWDRGNNPKTAVFEFLKRNQNWKIDQAIDQQLQISAARSGYLFKKSE